MTHLFDLLAQSESYQFGQQVGRIFLFVIIIVIAVGVIRKRRGK